MTLAVRIKKAMKDAGIKEAELIKKVADLLGEKVNQQTINAAITGRSQTTGYAVPIAYVCEVNPYWLALGWGEQHSPEQPIKRLDSNAKELLTAVVHDILECLKERHRTHTSHQIGQVTTQLFDRFLKERKIDDVALQDTLDLLQ